MTNDKLASHISSKIWNVSKEEIVNTLASYEDDKKLDYSYIHVQLPPEKEVLTKVIDKLTEDNLLLKDCVNDLDERLKKLEPQQDINEAPTLKRNLSLDNTEQEYLTPQEQFKHNQWRQRK